MQLQYSRSFNAGPMLVPSESYRYERKQLQAFYLSKAVKMRIELCEKLQKRSNQLNKNLKKKKKLKWSITKLYSRKPLLLKLFTPVLLQKDLRPRGWRALGGGVWL